MPLSHRHGIKQYSKLRSVSLHFNNYNPTYLVNLSMTEPLSSSGVITVLQLDEIRVFSNYFCSAITGTSQTRDKTDLCNSLLKTSCNMLECTEKTKGCIKTFHHCSLK